MKLLRFLLTFVIVAFASTDGVYRGNLEDLYNEDGHSYLEDEDSDTDYESEVNYFDGRPNEESAYPEGIFDGPDYSDALAVGPPNSNALSVGPLNSDASPDGPSNSDESADGPSNSDTSVDGASYSKEFAKRPSHSYSDKSAFTNKQHYPEMPEY